jgi:hypothetical protein
LRRNIFQIIDIIIILFLNVGDPSFTIMISFNVIAIDEANKATESDIWNIIAYYNSGRIFSSEMKRK